MILIESFSFFKNNFDLLKRLNHRQPRILIELVLIALRVVVFFRFDKLTALLLRKRLVKKAIKEKTAVFIFGANHASVLSQLQKVSFDFSVYNFDSDLDDKDLLNKPVTIGFPYLILGIIVNAKEFILAWTKGKKLDYINQNFFRLLKTSGYHPIFKELLKFCKVIVKFNDHNPYHNLLSMEAKIKGIKTVYIQHAPVSYKFPPLHHDLNVLFSEDSLRKYKRIDDRFKVKLLFDFRFLGGLSKRYAPINNKAILIAFNKLDDLVILSNLVEHLSNDYDILIRPHPADNRNFEFFTKFERVAMSKSKSIWDDLLATSAIICNETAVPLEAIFFNRLVYKAAFLSEAFDNYGFLEKGLLTKEFSRMEDLVEAISSSENYVNKEHLDFFIGNFTDYNKKIRSLYNEILHLGSKI